MVIVKARKLVESEVKRFSGFLKWCLSMGIDHLKFFKSCRQLGRRDILNVYSKISRLKGTRWRSVKEFIRFWMTPGDRFIDAQSIEHVGSMLGGSSFPIHY